MKNAVREYNGLRVAICAMVLMVLVSGCGWLSFQDWQTQKYGIVREISDTKVCLSMRY